MALTQIQDGMIAGMSASKLAGQVPKVNAPSGSVIQVVQAVFNGTYSRSMSSPSNQLSDISGWNALITPTLATSKILVEFAVTGSFDYSSGVNGNGTFGIRFIRNGSAVPGSQGTGGTTTFQAQSAGNPVGWESLITVVGQYLDSPGSTSAQNYQLQLGTHSYGGQTCYLNRSGRDGGGNEAGNGRYISTLTLTEIAA